MRKNGKKLLSLALALVMVLAILPTAALADFAPMTGGTGILGQVLDEKTGQPPESVTATLRYDDESSDVITVDEQKTVDSDGKFQFTYHNEGGKFPAGNYTLTFTSPFYLTKTVPIQITGTSGSEIVQQYLAPGGSIYGTVTDAQTGAALSGVTVKAMSGGSVKRTATTDGAGQYRLELESGTYTIEFSKANYQTKTLNRSFGPGTEAHIGTDNVQLLPGSNGGTSTGDDTGSNTDGNTGGGTDSNENTSSVFQIKDGVLVKYNGPGGAVSIPNSVTSIGGDAFGRCTRLTSVTIPSSVTYIGEAAFWDCIGLTSVTIPNSVTYIGEAAFRGCIGLTSVTIPNSVTEIGSMAFYGCTGLTSVTILDGVASIGEWAFMDCTSLTMIQVDPNNQFYATVDGVLFNKSMAELIQCPAGRKGSYTIPNSVTSIGEAAFWGCTALTCVNIPISVIEVGPQAFGDCAGLTSMTIPNSVTSIGSSAFQNCIGLTSVIVPNNVAKIEYCTFGGCTSLTSVTIPDSVKEIEFSAFEDCVGLISVTIPNSVNEIGPSVFKRCVSLTEVNIPNSVTKIRDDVFYGCTSLASMTIPDSITYISNKAFYGCTSLKDIYYSGNMAQWNSIVGIKYNYPLESVTIHYDSTVLEGGGENPNQFYQAQNPVTDTKSLLTSYVDNWNTAYTAYTEAVDKAVRASASTTASNRDEVIQSQKYAMMDADSRAGNRGSRYLTGAGFPDDEVKNAAYEAFATFLYDYVSSSPAIDLSKISAEDINGPTLVKNLFNGFLSESATYKIGAVEVKISMIGYGANVGMLTCTSKQVAGLYTYGICSSTAKCEEVIRDYMRELAGLENSAIYQVYSAVCKDVLGQPLDKLTQNYSKTKLQPLLAKLPANVGALLTDLNSCYNYYQYVKKMMGWAQSADSPENILAAMQGIEFKDESIQDKGVKKAWKSLKKASSYLNDAYMSYLSGTLDESKLVTWWNNTVEWWSDLVTSKTTFTCPVNVSVYDSSGKQIGYVGDDDIWYIDGLIYIEEKGDAKIVYSFTDDLISFQVSATDYGTLGCCIEQYNEEGQPIGRTNYYDIELSPDKTMTVSSQGGGTGSYKIIADNKVIDADEYIPSSQDAAVSISCSSEAGGTISGAGTYIRGDAVVLLAEPKDDYSFIGWYQNDDLMCTSRIYEFTAKEDASLKAVFKTNSPVALSFTDVPSGSWYYDAVQWAVEQGITNGTGTNPPTFSPNNSCTRAQMATFLWRVAGSPKPKGSTNPFTDVQPDTYYYDAVLWAVEQGITNGTSVTTFSPDTIVTRAQTVTFLYRTANSPAVSGSNPFTDVPVGMYYSNAVQWAVGKGITNGTSATAFSPNADCTRGQIVTLLYRDRAGKT